MNEDTALIAFNSINNFVNDLSVEFGNRHKPLALYKRLISRTPISQNQIIRKHIDIFSRFCSANREALLTQSEDKLVTKLIEYSAGRVYIDMGLIFRLADNETRPVIWKHLLTISAIVDPAGNAKEILRKSVESGENGKEEVDFLTTMISKVEQKIDRNASNPMEAVSSIMQSGLLNEMMSDIGSNQLDMTKLLGAVKTMVGNLQEQSSDPESKQAVDVLNNLTDMFGNGNQPPDMSKMMQVFSTLMGNFGGMPKFPEQPKST